MSTPFKDRKPPTDSEIREYFRILKNNPKSRVFAPLAEALIRRGRLEESEKLCIHGTEKNPHFSDGHLAYSRVLFYLFRYIDALTEVKKTLALDSSNIEAYLIAAEIFLSRSQTKATSDACMKVLDLDPTNSHALQILKKLNPAIEDEAGQDQRFSTISGTAPSSKRIDPAQAPAMTNPFEQLMHELHTEGAKLLDDEQPFTALSSGSQVEIPVFDEEDEEENEEFTQPTQPIKMDAPIPKLPAHPPTPAPLSHLAAKQQGSKTSEASSLPQKGRSKADKLEDLLSQVPKTPANKQKPAPENAAEPEALAIKSSSTDSSTILPPGPSPEPSQAQSAFSSQSQITSWQRIDAAQNIIDSYSDRIQLPTEGPAPKFSRLQSTISSLGLIALISAVLVLVVYLLSTETKKMPLADKRSYKPPAASSQRPQTKNESAKVVGPETKRTEDAKDSPETKTAEASITQEPSPAQVEEAPQATQKTARKTEPRVKKKKTRKRAKKKLRKRRLRKTRSRHRTRRRKR